MATLLPEGKQSFTDDAGNPLVGGKLYTYDAGTNTPRPTFADAAGTIPNTNPVILNARGEATVFWDGSYKVVLKDANDVTIWTVDNIRDIYRMVVDALEADGAIAEATAEAEAYAAAAAASAAAAAGKRLLNIQVFSNGQTGTITWNPAATFWRIRLLGAGGRGANTAATAAGQYCVGEGGGCGGYTEVTYTSATLPAGVCTYQVGDNGNRTRTFRDTFLQWTTPVAGLLKCPGGSDGIAASVTTVPTLSNLSGPSASQFLTRSGAANSAVVLAVGHAISGGPGLAFIPTRVGGAGTPSAFGPGSPGGRDGGNTLPSWGAGGDGASSGPSSGALTGQEGGWGVLIIEEYA